MLIIQGYVRRGLHLVEGNSKALAEEAFELITNKHPQHEKSWVPQDRPTGGSDDPVLLSLYTVTLAVDPKVGIDPRGFRPYYVRALAVGRIFDLEANGAFAAFTRLGCSILTHGCQHGSAACSVQAFLRL